MASNTTILVKQSFQPTSLKDVREKCGQKRKSPVRSLYKRTETDYLDGNVKTQFRQFEKAKTVM